MQPAHRGYPPAESAAGGLNQPTNWSRLIVSNPSYNPQSGPVPPQPPPVQAKQKRFGFLAMTVAVVATFVVGSCTGALARGSGSTTAAAPGDSPTVTVTETVKGEPEPQPTETVTETVTAEPNAEEKKPEPKPEKKSEPKPEEKKPETTKSQEQALRAAEGYLEYAAFSKKGLAEQLEYEDFSKADAEWAAEHVDADWNEQAVKAALNYLEYSAFSESELADQLEYEGFTAKQAKHGASEAYKQ